MFGNRARPPFFDVAITYLPITKVTRHFHLAPSQQVQRMYNDSTAPLILFCACLFYSRVLFTYSGSSTMLCRGILRARNGAPSRSLLGKSVRRQFFSTGDPVRYYSSHVAGQPSAALPLAGYRVLDLTRVLAGVSK